MFRLLLLTGLALTSNAEIPEEVLAERNLEKRSELAVKEAEAKIGTAAAAYNDAEYDTLEIHLKSIEELTQFTLQSLHDSGKRASRSPKYFKRAQVRLRAMMRRMDSLINDVSAADRERVQQVKKVLSEVHDQILHEIMSKK